jgi:hypothetical protein
MMIVKVIGAWLFIARPDEQEPGDKVDQNDQKKSNNCDADARVFAVDGGFFFFLHHFLRV